MTDRLDWDTLTVRGWEETQGRIPKHPRPNSIRQRYNTYRSNVKDGICWPAFYYVPDVNEVYGYAHYIDNGDLYFAEFGWWGNEFSNPTKRFLLVWKSELRYDPLPGSSADYSVECAAYDRFFPGWKYGTGFYTSDGPQPRYNSPISCRENETGRDLGGGFAGPQCFLGGEKRGLTDYPDEGPDGFAWPPRIDAWWLDQF